MKLLLPIILITLLAISYFTVQQFTKQKSSPTKISPPSTLNQELKTFNSEYLKFSIEIPSSFEPSSSTTAVDLTHPDGSIEIVRNGTQFSNLMDYVKEFDSKRIITTKTSENIKISGLEAMKRIEDRIVGGIDKTSEVYYILVHSSVYILSTDSQSLYDELDQIARSFRYIP